MADQEVATEGSHFLDYWQVITARKEIVIAVLLLMVIAGVVITRNMPRVYQATCRIQVQRESPDIDLYGQTVIRYDPFFLRTQFELIQSDRVLEDVVRELNLTEVFGRAYGYLERMEHAEAFERTVRQLSSKMRVQQQRDTDLILISMLFDKPDGEAVLWAARAANSVAKVFKAQMQLRSRQATVDALDVLRIEIEEQDQRIDDAEARLDAIREEYQITDVGASESIASLNAQVMAQAEMDRARAELELKRKEARYEQVMALQGDQLLSALPFIVQSQTLSLLVASKRDAEIKMEILQRSELGPQHPEVVRTRALVREYDTKIGEEVESIRFGLLTEIQASRASYERLVAFVEDLKQQERRQSASGYRAYRRVLDELRVLRERRTFLDDRLIRERISLRIPHTSVNIIEEAKANPAALPVSPNTVMNILLSVLAGLATGVALAFFVEYLDTSLKTVEDVERHLATQVLGIVPQKVRMLNDPLAQVSHSEAYRVLRTNVKSSKKLAGGSIISVTSASVAEGKSHTLFNLAYVSGQLGDRVLIVDADLHRPRQHKLLGVENAPGLTNMLIGEAPLDEVIRHTDIPTLDFLPSGKLQGGSVHGLLDTELMRECLAELKKHYEWIYLDSPPLIGVSDASQLVRISDATLLVVQHRKYPRAMSRRAKEMVENLGGNLLGVVLNNINISRDYSSYYYKSHYYYYPYVGNQA